MKKTRKKTKFKGRQDFQTFIDDMKHRGGIPSIVLDLKHYQDVMKELAELRNCVSIAEGNRIHERAAHAIEARAAEHRYAIATAALEQANGQIVALKAAVSAFAHSTEALGVAVQPAKIERWQAPEITNGLASECRVTDASRVASA